MLNNFLFSRNDKKDDSDNKRKNLEPDYNEMCKRYNFNVKELKKLYQRFKLICNSNTEVVEKRQFLQQPEFMLSPFISLSFDLELKNQQKNQKLKENFQLVQNNANDNLNDDNESKNNENLNHVVQNGENVNGLNFESFISLINIYSPKTSNQVKLSYYFDLIDQEHEGIITKESYGNFLKNYSNEMIPQEHFNEAITVIWNNITEKTGTNYLTRDQMGHLISLLDLHMYFTVSY